MNWKYINIILLIMVVVSLFNIIKTNDGNPTYRPVDNNREIEGILIPRSVSDSAKYYLLSEERDGIYIKTIHKRVSSSSLGFSVTKIDCMAVPRRYKDLGYGEGAIDNLKMYKDRHETTNWVNVMSGSSKSDLVYFVCKNYKTPSGKPF